MLKKNNVVLPLCRICHLKMSYLTIGRRICHLKMSYLTIGHPQAQHLPNILRLPRPRVRLRWTSTRATMNMLSANASAMRCVVNGVKMTMMRDVARRLTPGGRNSHPKMLRPPPAAVIVSPKMLRPPPAAVIVTFHS